MASIQRLPSERAVSALWGGPFVVGLLLTVLGLIALSSSFITGLVSILLLGTFLLVAGGLEVFYAFRRRKNGPFFLYLLGGILSLVVGGLMLFRPLAGLATVTLLLAGYFFTGGIFRGVTSLLDRYPSWGWDFASGVVSFLLGVMLFAQGPSSALWVVGTLVGVEFIVRGAALMSGAFILRRALV
ncbi:HdeD family acid-resistance protein [Stigmatella aurantiaca]|uniref:Conserved uncharacterized protein n=1 Tax=Stigmatella aurantiaca (strain DW4/3-1) TaxID=378806 RepID=Q094D2_STIAD|nr:HdeD family acid-resistance protein [Stigmatella aurantiaca]ADO68138.1 conserved uncharacterized protein [Stigmatella aurantiaca DW4/3-1]EAU67094.1 conserved hypothetical protein [Stigmatella aurantiaca DW4/3-1]